MNKDISISIIKRSLTSFQFNDALFLSSLLYSSNPLCEESCYLHVKCLYLIKDNPIQVINQFMHLTNNRSQKLLYILALHLLRSQLIAKALAIIKEFFYIDCVGKFYIIFTLLLLNRR